MEPLEINAMVNLLKAAGTLSSQLRDDWYKVSAELDVFKFRVFSLSEKYAHWVELMRKCGLDDDEKLTKLAKEAFAYVEKEEKHVQKMKESRLRRWKQRAFPGQLTSKLDAIEQIVTTGITVLESRVKSSDVAERHLNYDPIPLPFGPDRKYVPIVQSIDEVKAAIEKEASGTHAIRVATVYGKPGMGKTCLLKHLALHYDSAKKKQADGTESKIFPDGVFYLPCGSGKSHRKIKELQLKLTQSLGSGSEPVSRVQTDGITEKLHGETLPDYDKLVRLKLKHQKVLIILDDVWEREVLEAVLIPGKAVTYLVSSQDSDIWDGAEKICMKSPTREEARKILAKYIDGLAENAELPGNIKDIADGFISELQFHPLTLAHVGLIITSDHANDPDEWINLRKSWHAELPKQGGVKPTVFHETYPMALSETMNRMVDSLSESERSLLFLICLFEKKNTIPEAVVRRFHKHLKPQESPYDYRKGRKILQNKCLIEVLSYEGSRRSDPGASSRHARKVDLVIHGIRARCIIQKNAEQLRSMAKQLFDPTTATNLSVTNASNFHGNRRTMIHSQGGAEGRASARAQGVYTAVMGSMYLSKIFWDVVATNFQRLLGRVSRALMMIRSIDSSDGNERSQQVLDDAIMGAMYLSKSFWPRGVAATKVHTLLRSVDVDVPPRMYANMDVSELMERAGDMKEQIKGLASVLNREEEGEGEWKEPAWYARKIILKFICRQELDDESTARLIKLPLTASVICDALKTILSKGYWSSTFVHQNKTFSNGHAETTKCLLTVLLDNQTTTDIRKSVIQVLEGVRGSIRRRLALGSGVDFYWGFRPGVFDYECGDSIATIGKTLMNQLAKDVHHVTGNLDDILNRRKRVSVWMYNLPEVWKVLMLRRSRSDNFVPLRAYDGQSYAQVVENLPTLSDSDCLSIIRHLLQWRFTHAPMDDARFLDTFCNLAASIVGRLRESVESREYNQEQISCHGRALGILADLSGIPENREQIWANELFQNNLGHILKWGTDSSGYDLGVGGMAKHRHCHGVAGPEELLTVSDDDHYLSIEKGRHHAISILGQLCLSEKVRDSFASSFPTLEKKLRTLQFYIIAHYDLLTEPVRKDEYADLVREISKVRTILNPMRMYSQTETTYASPLSEHIFRGRFVAFHEMKMYEKANVYVDMKTEGGEPLLEIPTSLAVYVKAMSKDYKGAMAYPRILQVARHFEVRFSYSHFARVKKKFEKDEQIFLIAEQLGERGVLQQLSGENLIEARKDFDTSLNLIHSLSPEFLSNNLEKCANLLYRLFQQRGFVKYKLKDSRGAREDAKAAQELECRSLVRKTRSSLCEPTSLLALPVTYLGFTFIRGYGVFEVKKQIWFKPIESTQL